MTTKAIIAPGAIIEYIQRTIPEAFEDGARVVTLTDKRWRHGPTCPNGNGPPASNQISLPGWSPSVRHRAGGCDGEWVWIVEGVQE